MPIAQPALSLPFLRAGRHGDLVLDIQVVPHAAKTQVDGLYGEQGQIALKLRLNAPPVDGKANEALIKWLASQLGIPRSALQVVRGQTSRRKQLGLSADVAAKADWHRLTRDIVAPLAVNNPSIAIK